MLVSFTFNRTEEDKTNNPEVKPIFSKKIIIKVMIKQVYIINNIIY
jgi:hypothetical protein